MDRYGPLQYLINGLNQRAWRGVASAFLIELGKQPAVRQSMYPLVGAATKDEKIQMSMILAQSGDTDTLPPCKPCRWIPTPMSPPKASAACGRFGHGCRKPGRLQRRENYFAFFCFC